MRLLCVDHYFAQDIEAIQASVPAGSRCWSIGWEHFYVIARRFFPEEVFTGIEAYFRPEHAAARDRYANAVSRELERLHRIYRFDALLAPSDTFFWIRAPAQWCREHGIPFVVLQKEATIPPGWMEGPAREWGEISPFIGDLMLVSSDHHRQFWINAGVSADTVVVTGQPRFDLYARPERRRTWRELGIAEPSRPAVLFLTYDASAYLPLIDRTGLAPWLQMRTETEQALLELARAGEVEVLVKPHPQPAEDQTAHLRELAREPGVRILDPRGDVRYSILNADVVVGFQSTALLEALAAGRPTIYTWWTEQVEHAAGLIPFHEQPEAISVARSPEELQQAVRSAVEAAPAGSDAARELVELYLGRVDGHAAERCLAEIVRICEGTAVTPARRKLQSVARAERAQTLGKTAAAAGTWAFAARVTPLAYRAHRLHARVGRRQAVDSVAFREHLARLRRRSAQDLRAFLG
jgi:CDP-Glycerol:Poly(glycerophosphate) glycerophosphotransferase